MLQELYEESASQIYPIGMRYAKDERVFRYALSGSDLLSAWGAQAWNAFSSGANRESATIAAAGVAGGTTLTLTAVGTVTVDMFKGGYACIYWEMSYYRIKSNTAAAPGGTFVITLEDTLEQAIDAASVVSLYRNKYADVRRLVGGDETLWASTVGIPLRNVQSGYYHWLQTWGPCVGVGVDNIGQDASQRGLYFLASGALFTMVGPEANANQPANQYAGYLLPYTGPGPTGVDQPGALIHFELQLAP